MANVSSQLQESLNNQLAEKDGEMCLVWLPPHAVCVLSFVFVSICSFPHAQETLGTPSYVSPDKESCRTVWEGGHIATVRQNEKEKTSPKLISTLNPSCCSLILSIDSQSGIYCRSWAYPIVGREPKTKGEDGQEPEQLPSPLSPGNLFKKVEKGDFYFLSCESTVNC